MEEKICKEKIVEDKIYKLMDNIYNEINNKDYPEFYSKYFKKSLKYELYSYGNSKIVISVSSWDKDLVIFNIDDDIDGIKTIIVCDKKFYKFAKYIGKKFGAKKLIKCWKGVI